MAHREPLRQIKHRDATSAQIDDGSVEGHLRVENDDSDFHGNTLAPASVRLGDGVNLDRNLLPLDLHLSQVAHDELSLDLFIGRLADDDGDVEILGDAFQTGAQIDGVPNGRVLEALFGPDGPHDSVAGVYADPAVEVGAVLGTKPPGQRLEAVLEHQRRPHGLRRVVRLVERHIVEGHDAVADVLVHGPPVLEHHVGHDREVFTEEGDHILRRHLLGHGGEASDVREEDRHPPTSARQVGILFLADDLRDHGGREITGQPLFLTLRADEVFHHRSPIT